MKTLQVMVVIFLVLCVVSLGLTGFLYYLRQQELVKIETLEGQVSDLDGQVTQLGDKVKVLEDDKKKLTDSLDKEKSLVESYKIKLRDQKDEYLKEKQRADDLSKEVDSVRLEYADYKKTSTALLDGAKAQNQTLADKLKAYGYGGGSSLPVAASAPAATPAAAPAAPVTITLDSQTAGVEREGTGDGVDLEPVVVHPSVSIKGKIEVVNRKFNFLVSNIGRTDGLNIGDVVKVTRNGEQIATARVEKLYENLSASAIEQEDQANQIQEGDTVEV